METTRCAVPAHDVSAWPIAGLLIDALTRRDFDALRAVFDDDVRFRALVPSGPFELSGAEAVAGKFRSWFGGADDFDVLDASIGEVGARLYARWRVEMRPSGRPGSSRVAEQHAFTTGTTRIASLDLLCSGFQGSNR